MSDFLLQIVKSQAASFACSVLDTPLIITLQSINQLLLAQFLPSYNLPLLCNCPEVLNLCRHGTCQGCW